MFSSDVSTHGNVGRPVDDAAPYNDIAEMELLIVSSRLVQNLRIERKRAEFDEYDSWLLRNEDHTNTKQK